MKYLLRILLVLCLGGMLLAMIQPKKTRVVFFGDSITEAGVKPGGFIDRMNEALKAKSMADQYELIGAGIGGNKIYDLYLRMEDDVLSKEPDVVVIWIGVNDVWHKQLTGTGTDPDKFQKFYAAVIGKLQAKKIRVILCTPAAIGEKIDFTNQQDGDLNKYAQFIRDLAKKQNCGLVDFRELFHRYALQHNPENKDSGILTTDRVHLNEYGNQLVADNLLTSITAK